MGIHRWVNGEDGKRSGPAKVARIAGLVIAGLALAALFALLFGWLVMLLWNWLMPSLFGLKCITYWQAFGVVLLAKLLFGSAGEHHAHTQRGHHAPQRVVSRPAGGQDAVPLGDMPEPSSRFRDYWRTEGKAAFERFLDRARGSAGEHGKA